MDILEMVFSQLITRVKTCNSCFTDNPDNAYRCKECGNALHPA